MPHGVKPTLAIEVRVRQLHPLDYTQIWMKFLPSGKSNQIPGNIYHEYIKDVLKSGLSLMLSTEVGCLVIRLESPQR